MNIVSNINNNSDVLYNKWRPRRFEDVVGHSQIIKILQAYIDSGYNTSIIFSGQYGCGKTTLTKIMAAQYHDNHDAIWDNNHPAVLRISASDRVGVDEITRLLDTVQYKPLVGTNKTYIIDEFHALSNAAFKTFLNILDTLPPNTRFFFATTDICRIPQDVISRCFVLNIGPVQAELILDRIKKIANAEGIVLPEKVLRFIARGSNGSVRDAIKYLQQVAMLGTDPAITNVEHLLEIPSEELIISITNAIRNSDYSIFEADLPSISPYEILVALIKQIRSFSDTEKWVPVISALTESIELTQFGLEGDLILFISISKAMYAYKLAQGIKITGNTSAARQFEHKVQELFPNAVKED